MLFPGDLLDSSDVRNNDIVPGALLNLNVWNMWHSLVEAAGTGDIDQVCIYIFHLYDSMSTHATVNFASSVVSNLCT